jgi:2'-5' RNA ligase
MEANWFFACPVEAGFVADLPPPPARVRAFVPADVHMTVAFAGRCGEAAAHSALATLDALLDENPVDPFEVSLGEVVAMGGSRRGYSALSALIALGREAAVNAIAQLEGPLLQAAAARPSTRPPNPHVTLARPERRADAATLAAGRSWAATLDLHHVVLRIDRIALYTWAADRRERLFHIMAERPLCTV